MRQLLEQSPLTWKDDTISVTTSIGDASGAGLTEVEQLLHDADLALYRAKVGGRNQVVCEKPCGIHNRSIGLNRPIGAHGVVSLRTVLWELRCRLSQPIRRRPTLVNFWTSPSVSRYV
ncbi:MAG: hypothetical protein LH632_05820 [Rhodoferax sp.]|nr:hypothetical protein [Rhodoferax sp.]